MGFVNFIVELLKDPRTAIASAIAAGPVVAYGFVFLIIFIETGVVFFPFLPGDSLLFASGFFAHNGGFNIFMLLGIAWAAAILGDQCNFMIGHFFGKRIVASGKVKAMTPERVKKTEDFLDKWGHLAVFLGRFFPFIRTFVPFLSGMGGMHWRNFVIFNQHPGRHHVVHALHAAGLLLWRHPGGAEALRAGHRGHHPRFRHSGCCGRAQGEVWQEGRGRGGRVARREARGIACQGVH